ncbi:hypothetical protein SPI_07725 [Niveomyces insectorum RCEF 264]|uniref:Uncharacterized protein n=1 Tax=Niveomyces insectorum RCEF 264 TaxID=1081102 RepID=A0A167PJD5_9HYPO|nr:hypothetical protein SPI_07725 [Niveomyces insectorum RCEF 264]
MGHIVQCWKELLDVPTSGDTRWHLHAELDGAVADRNGAENGASRKCFDDVREENLAAVVDDGGGPQNRDIVHFFSGDVETAL